MASSSRRALLKNVGLIAGAMAVDPPVTALAGSRLKNLPDMDQLREQIQGVHCFMVTPFQRNGQLDGTSS